MSKNFVKYPSIENSYRDKFIQKIVEEGYGNETYYVEEKIHGSNFQFCFKNGDIIPGKRTGIIKEDEKFFSYKNVVEKYKTNIIDLAETICSDISSDNVEIIVFGELYGGIYPGVKPSINCTKVQRGVYYTPENDFICFDIYVREIDKENSFFISKSARDIYCEKCGVPFARTLFKGSLKECLAFDKNFQSTIPALKNLPTLPEDIDNTAEGVVIRPENSNLRLYNGDRVIIKNKNEKFKENSRSPKRVSVPKTIHPDVKKLLDKAEMFINKPRLDAVISKIGEFDPKKFGEYIKEFNRDILKDFNEDFGSDLYMLEKGLQKEFSKNLNNIAVKFMKSILF